MTTAFRESWKAPWIKLLLQGPGVSAASGDENTMTPLDINVHELSQYFNCIVAT
jgi:hypothetical protein